MPSKDTSSLYPLLMPPVDSRKKLKCSVVLCQGLPLSALHGASAMAISAQDDTVSKQPRELAQPMWASHLVHRPGPRGYSREEPA